MRPGRAALFGAVDGAKRGLVARGPGLLGLVLCLVLAGLAGCTPRPLSAVGGSPVADYQGTWEYRYGDSPRGPDGAFLWAQPGSQDPGWQPTKILEDPPGRNGAPFMWMRTRLVGPELREPVLFVVDIDNNYEAYLDGKLIDEYGPMEGRRYTGLPKVYLPLGPGYAGKLLTLRIYSPYSFIGLFGTPRLGGRAEMVVDVIDTGLPPAVTGMLLMFLGLVSGLLYALRRQDRLYLYYTGVALGLGGHVLARSILRDLIVDLGPWWTYLELGGNALGCASLCGFMAQLFGAGPFGIVRRLGQVMLIGLGVGIVLVVTGTVHIWNLLRPLQVYFLVVILCVLGVAIAALRRREFDAKIFAVGMMLSFVIILFELMMLLGVLPRWRLTISQYASALFVMSLAVLLSLRFVRTHRRLQNYSTVLQLSLSQARVLEEGQHMQVALGEVLRLLGGDRALLFESGPAEREPKLTTGRRARGEPIGDEHDWDSTLITDVMRKRRPAVILRERDHTEMSSDRPPRSERLSIAAAPLLARGELLGVLYLESDAGHHLYHKEDLEILLGLCNQLALTLMTTRAVRLELEGALARRRLAEQEALLSAAGRMARGDLTSAIAVPASGELEPLARALEEMRKDLQVKFQKLEQSNTEIQQLNEELRRQIEHRSHRLMELVLRGERHASAGQVMPGRMLGEHYKVVRTLGKGAMGAVYEVERTTDQVRLAAKVLSEQSDRTALLRFAREAQILARLDHANLVSITDIDITATGVLFLVMELVRGTTLKLCRERYRDVGFATTVVQQIAEGLNAIHMRGIIHRDLKPANVLIADRDEGGPLVKLADFGVSTLMAGQEDTTKEDGTPAHMPVSAAWPPIGPEEGAYALEAEPPSEAELADGATLTAHSSMEIDALTSSELAGEPSAPAPPPARPVAPKAAPTAAGARSVSQSGARSVSQSGSRSASQSGARSVSQSGSRSGSGSLYLAGSGSQPSFGSGARSGSGSGLGGSGSRTRSAPLGGGSGSQGGGEDRDGHLTETGILVGTPMYMAPELSEGSRFARPPSDIFSLGVIAYELLSGEIPFSRPPVWARWRGNEVAAPSLATKRPDLPAPLVELVDSCLRIDPAQRPTAAEVAQALRAAT